MRCIDAEEFIKQRTKVTMEVGMTFLVLFQEKLCWSNSVSVLSQNAMSSQDCYGSYIAM